MRLCTKIDKYEVCLLLSLPSEPHTDTVVNSLAMPKASSTRFNCLNLATQVLKVVSKMSRSVKLIRE